MNNFKVWVCCEPLNPVRLEGDRQLKIGRSLDCELTLPHRSVSRVHARIRSLDGKLTITDLGSSNGTFVNDTRVLGIMPLIIDDCIKIGPYEAYIRETPTLMMNTQADLYTGSDRFTMVGQLSKTPLAEVLQSIELNEKTGTLRVQAGKEGILAFRKGLPLAAEYGSLAGVDAVMKMLTLHNVHFMVSDTVEAQRNSIGASFTSILLDFLRKSDEQSS